jgi:hypothetical protein
VPPSTFASAPCYVAEHCETLCLVTVGGEDLCDQAGGRRTSYFGSDYCFIMGYDQPVRFLDQVDVGSEQRTMILSGNAARRLKLQKPEQP